MAEENAFLDYNDGFVLHNGLPVKWIANSADLYNDYDLIIEQSNPNYAYEGFTIPISYTTSGNAWFNQSTSARAAISGASAGWGLSTAMIDGDVKIKSYNKPAQVVHKTGTPTTVTSTSPKIPTEYSGTKTRAYSDVYGVIYPKNQNHFFIGVKFANNYGVPSMPDLTNHGNAGGTSVIHKIYAPHAGSFLGMINASNYTAVKNVYAPNLVITAMGLNHLDEEYGVPAVKTRLFENWYIPNATFLTQNAAQTNTAWSANLFASDTSAKGITANEVRMNDLKQFEDISAFAILAIGDYNTTVAKNVSATWDLNLTGFKSVENIYAPANISLVNIASPVSGISVSNSADITNVPAVDGFTAKSAACVNINELSNVKTSAKLDLRNVTSVNNVEASGVLSANYINMNMNHVSGYGKCYVNCISSNNFNDVYFENLIHPSFTGSFQLDGNALKDVTANSALLDEPAGTIYANSIENVHANISARASTAMISAVSPYINGLYVTSLGSGPQLTINGSSAFNVSSNRNITFNANRNTPLDVVSGMSASQIINLSANSAFNINAGTVNIKANKIRNVTRNGTTASGTFTLSANDISAVSGKSITLFNPVTVKDLKTDSLLIYSATNPTFDETVSANVKSYNRCTLTNRNLGAVHQLYDCQLYNVSANGRDNAGISVYLTQSSGNNILLDASGGYSLGGYGGFVSGLKLKLYPSEKIHSEPAVLGPLAFTGLCYSADIYNMFPLRMDDYDIGYVSAVYSGTMALSSNVNPDQPRWMGFAIDCVLDYRNVELVGSAASYVPKTFLGVGSAHYILPNRWKTNNQITGFESLSGATCEWVD